MYKSIYDKYEKEINQLALNADMVEEELFLMKDMLLNEW